MDQPELKGATIFDIQGFSVHDGPGCRTLVFFKGCSLHCAWCSNPEGINPFPEPLYNHSKCLFDNLCIETCQKNAIISKEDDLIFDRTLCSGCTTFDCARVCCSQALKIGGYFITINELFRIILRDRQYWGNRGGITLTGGEPFSQPDFAALLLKKCYDSFIHTAVETCGNIPWKDIERSLDYLDWILYDLKHTDSHKHKQLTGTGNRMILDNARRLAKIFKGRLVFRTPIIPGFNDDEQTILRLSEFLESLGKNEINILPVHHLGREKYSLLGKAYYTRDFQIPRKGNLLKVQAFFESRGIRCYLGSETPF